MRKVLILLTLFGGLLTLTSYSYQNNLSNQIPMPNNNDPFAKQWKTIDSLEQKGLPQSALKEVEALYPLVKTKHPDQLVKVLIYREKYKSQLEEDGLINSIGRLEKELEASDTPVQSILYSMLAELYSSYLSNNYWRFNNRSEIVDYQPDDVKTWSISQLTAKANAYYLASVKDKSTQQLNIEDYEVILTGGKDTKKLRPTVYDFLAHRAIDHFSNEQSYLTAPAYKFDIRADEAFADVNTFIKYPFKTQDTSNQQFLSIQIFQDLLAFHQQSDNVAALVDADLKRLKFVYQKAVNDLKDELYLDALQQLANTHSNNPVQAEVLYYQAAYWQQKGQSYNPQRKQLANRDALKKAHELCQQAIKTHPDSHGETLCAGLQQQIERKQLNIKVEQVNKPNQPFLLAVDYKNIPKLYFKIIAIDEKDRARLDRESNTDRLAFFDKQPAIKTWQSDLKEIEDFQNHLTELKVPALPVGQYAIIASDQADFTNENTGTAYVYTHISNLSYWFRLNHNNDPEFVVMDRQNGKPLNGVQTEVYAADYGWFKLNKKFKIIGSAKSDKNGFVRPNVPENEYFRLKFKHGSDYLMTDDGFSHYSKHNNSRSYEITHFFLDRAIYRPGQTVYFKALALQKDKSDMPIVLANQPITITLKDVNHQDVATLELTTNEYGTVNGTFTAPSGGLLGQMHLTSDVGNNYHYFRVEEYKRPKFKVDFKPVTNNYKLGDKVSLTGVAKAFAGNSIDEAKVQYRVVREVRYPWRPWWFYRPSGGQNMEISNGITTTDADGKFEVEVALIPDRSADKKQQPQFVYTIYADVTDITGETHSQTTTIKASEVALTMNINVAEQVNIADFEQLEVQVQNLSGVFQPTTAKLTIHQLETPSTVYNDRYWTTPDVYSLDKNTYKNEFPAYAYQNENQQQHWKKDKKVIEDLVKIRKESDQKINITKFKWQPGVYVIQLEAKDAFDNDVKQIKYLEIYDLKGKKSRPVNLFIHALDKENYQPKDVVKAYLGSNQKALNVLFEIERNGQIVSSEWVAANTMDDTEIMVTEEDRGNFHLHYSYVFNSRSFHEVDQVNVPWTNKELQITYGTFRDKLRPGEAEEWQIKISGSKNEKVAAEMVTAMYDASLDQFVKHNWDLSPFPTKYGANRNWQPQGFNLEHGRFYANSAWYNHGGANPRKAYSNLNWFGFSMYGNYYSRNTMMLESVVTGASPKKRSSRRAKEAMSAPVPQMEAAEAVNVDQAATFDPSALDNDSLNSNPPKENTTLDQVPVRTNLKETVFFFPNLRTDEEGNIIIKFTMNEALTQWKFLGLAHTQDLQIGLTEKTVVTQKELMVQPNAPRFVREGDRLEFTAKVANLTEKELNGSARLYLFNALTMEPIDQLFGNQTNTLSFKAAPGQSARLAWELEMPRGELYPVTHRIVATSGDFSDGEESVLPILTNRTLVTETMPLPVKGGENKTFTFEAFDKAKDSKTLAHHNLALEFTSNPAWYAIQALPYLMDYPHECSEQIFSRYYANSLATSVANAYPRVKQVFEQWQATGEQWEAGTEALASNLTKNQELKSALIAETPWVLNAQNETQQKQNIALLFDLNRMAQEQQTALTKLQERQLGNGGFAWFPGGNGNWYITQYMAEGFGHLNRLGVYDFADNQQAYRIAEKTVRFIDGEIADYYDKLLKRVKDGYAKLEEDNLSAIAIHYLYARSFYLDIPITGKTEEAFNYYRQQAEKYWLGKGIYQEGMIALALDRIGEKAVPKDIIKSLKERAITHDELGMYWKQTNGYLWHQLPIETHALMMELFDEVANDKEAVDQLTIWLLKNKQTNHWKTTKATTAAVSAIMQRKNNWIAESEAVNVQLGKGNKAKAWNTAITNAQKEAEAGTGYFKVDWDKTEINQDMTTVSVSNPNEGIAWGALYWQYFEDFDKVKTFEETPLTIKKALFKTINSDTGPKLTAVTPQSKLVPGDKLTVRIEIRVDRPMEYLHLKDTRASGFEPINVLSQYKWQGGLGYYESTKDASTNFFISYLPTGTYVFEYPLRVTHKGDFSNGITTIQSMYAPEFTSHSEGIRVRVE